VTTVVRITSPLDDRVIDKLVAGTQVLISGVVYTARDAAHRRIVEALDRGEKPPFDLKGQTIYYSGPTPSRPGAVIGSIGPTTAGRVDVYTPRLLAEGIKGMIGKGGRSVAVREAIRKYRAFYFVATGGAGALLSKFVERAELIAYEDLGTEAVRRLVIKDLPAIVADDLYGSDLYELEQAKYRREG